MRDSKGFSLVELLIAVAVILVVAAIAIPNLLRSRIAANEASAVGSLRALTTSEITYRATYPNVGFTCVLSALGPPSSGSSATPTAAGLIDSNLAGGTKSGYAFAPGTCNAAGGLTVDYQWKAAPQTAGITGQRYFCTDASGVIRFYNSTASTCFTSGTPISIMVRGTGKSIESDSPHNAPLVLALQPRDSHSGPQHYLDRIEQDGTAAVTIIG